MLATGEGDELWLLGRTKRCYTALLHRDRTDTWRTFSAPQFAPRLMSIAGTSFIESNGGARTRIGDATGRLEDRDSVAGGGVLVLPPADLRGRYRWMTRTDPDGAVYALADDRLIVGRVDATEWDRRKMEVSLYTEAVWGAGRELFLVGNDSYGSSDGGRGSIVHSADGGRSFTLQRTREKTSLYAVGGAGGVVYAAGAHGLILRYQREARRWVREPSGTKTAVFRHLYCASDGRAYAFADDGVYVRTPKNARWRLLHPARRTTRTAVVAREIWLVSPQQGTDYTSDGGRSWRYRSPDGLGSLSDVAVVGHAAFALEVGGRLLRWQAAEQHWRPARQVFPSTLRPLSSPPAIFGTPAGQLYVQTVRPPGSPGAALLGPR